MPAIFSMGMLSDEVLALLVVKQMKDFLWGTTKVTPESSLGQEVGKFIGYCREAGTVKQVQSSGTELPLHRSKPVYRGVVTQENAPVDDWQASTSSRPELQWGPWGPYDDREANEGNFRQTLTSPRDSRLSSRDLLQQGSVVALRSLQDSSTLVVYPEKQR
ncbi:hypothetical protein DUI87_34492 [Hirundo rustica rustica]|uniref:Uncharacterized protein n=1 Tax=Hirundo rustica rustica TaxID=333673 RepID=A0A3M0IQC2_HIRRU|nr:hypothetical protein DUI87_34492 [Hirundo rustica rustica]